MCKLTNFAFFGTLIYEPRIYARLLTTATVFYFDYEEFYETGGRVYNIECLFNIKSGFGRQADTLSTRLLQVPLSNGSETGEIAELDKMLDEYYVLCGWDMNGNPIDRKFLELDLTTELRWPKLQVALDLRDLDEALRIAVAAHRGRADWMEAGTPLIKSAGMNAVRRLKNIFPQPRLSLT